ncbi:acyl-CoA desaturase [Streptacidiphilus albus]|uniref:acyl-CoA desaturase n=1 Tax=Streptacidiphilus albus TaxID=105425 RepID=UPI00054AFCED|nr:acyl-CoA desaturase [Streptacidiphilus albus]
MPPTAADSTVRGTVDPGAAVRGAARAVGADEFSPLLRSVRAAGLLERRTGWYARSIALNLLLLAATWAGVLLVGGSWWVLALALPAAVLGGRTAFLGHDAGHQQIAAGRRVNRVIGLVHGNLLLGMGVGWWTDKHNRHHANPNHIDKDPDVGVGALVWTQHQAAERVGFARWMTRHQAKLFFPLLLLEGVALKVSGIQHLRHQSPRERLVEGSLLAIHLVGYTALLLCAMNPLHALAFAALHHALFGLHLGSAFAPNHKGMEMPDPDGDRWGHLRRQVLTSRNVRGGPFTDFFLGGLNYQIDHHLFPSMPRPNLRAAQPLIRAHCARLGLPYTETGLVESYRQGLAHMHEVGAELRS